ncbi:MAG TPA: ABC transporter permease [Streptosporangiaceae bacterium]|jgi:NitT/TauT family transport system permease protein|nr:ABC transporter permease [Streptosporangiaceae bacterium]
MAADTEAAALAGLDSLELQQAGVSAGDRARKIWAAVWPKLLAIAIVIGVWELVYLSGWKSAAILPSPAAVFSDLWAQAHHALLWQAIATTLRRAVIGFGMALVIGVVLGALVSRIKPLRAAVGSMITALQTMPSIAWFPFAIILFGATTNAILFVIILGAAPSIANGLIAGVDYTPPLLLRAGRTMGLGRIAMYRHLILPASLPSFVAGLKQGWAFAWRSLMAGELLVIIMGQPSIGVLLSTFQDQSEMASTISIMIVILVLGIVVDLIFTRIDASIRRRRGMLDPAVS